MKMKRYISLILAWGAFLFGAIAQPAHAQFSFVPGQLLTAGELNNAFSKILPMTGGTLTGPLTVPSLAVSGSLNTVGVASVGGLSASGPINAVGAYTAPLNTGGYFTGYLSKSGVTGQSLYTGICTGCKSFDSNQAMLTIPSGSTVTTITGYGSYIDNQNGIGTPNTGNGVNYFSLQTCAVNNAACWAQNHILSDSKTWAASSVTGVQLNAAEYDFDVTSPHTNVQGPTLTGSSLVQPAFAGGFTVGALSVENPTLAKWTYAFITQDGVANVAMHIGSYAPAGPNVASQPITFNYYDSTGAVQAWTQQVGTDGTMSFSDGAAAHSFILNAPTRIRGPSGPAQLDLDSNAGQNSTLEFATNGAAQWQVGKQNTNCFFAYDVVAGAYVWQMCSGGTFAFTSPVSHAAQTIDKSYAYIAPASGNTVTMASGSETTLIDPAAALAALTVKLPACTSSYDGSIARFSTTQAITALTVGATAGTVLNPPTTLAAGAGKGYLCRGANTTWYALY
ncbi:hypothetical protein DM44_4775 [Burkholderia cepacia]|nr:hypothetical protein DM42_4001 [Burkholderia cepacia]KGC01757.1 hypothetical protein DM44_4775 [Burkholderia cepacia]